MKFKNYFSEEEVYGLEGVDDSDECEDDVIDGEDDHSEDDEEEDDSRMFDEGREDEQSDDVDSMASDLEDRRKFSDDEDGPQVLRASKSWGNKSSAFYGSDYQRQKKKTREEADALEDEEEEAVIAHKRALVNQLAENDFETELFFDDKNNEIENDSKIASSSVKVQPTLVTQEEKVANLKLRHPELEHMIEEYNSINEELVNELEPKLRKVNPDKPDLITEKQKLTQLKYTVYSHYVMCLSVYFLLKMNKEPTENHPVMEKLLDFRKYITKLNKFEKQSKSGTNKLNHKSNDESYGVKKNSNAMDVESFSKTEDAFDLYEQLKMYQEGKKTLSKLARENQEKETELERDQKIQRKKDQMSKLMVEKGGVTKRKVSRPIRVNKSVVEMRNILARKEKNPRTKNRKKSLIANIKRSGQVRPMRDASVNYKGETTGINVQAKRGTKLS